MVRPSSDIWKLFDVEKTDNKPKAVCKFCCFKYAFPNATRMTNHILNQCAKCPLEIKEKYDIGNKNKNPSNSTSSTSLTENFKNNEKTVTLLEDPNVPSTSSLSDNTTFESSLPTKRRKVSCQQQQTLSGFFDKIAVTESAKIDIAIARALYASGASFSFLKSKYWEEVFKMLRPSYQIPSAHALSTNLLNAEYERVQTERDQRLLESNNLSLITDGWTNIVGDGLINIIICTPTPLFYKTVHRGTAKETGTYISNELLEVIKEIGPQKFFLIVTDNASNMKAAWHIINTKYPHISCVGCAAHSLNLLLKDFMKENLFRRISQQSRKICKYFKCQHAIYAAFKNAQVEKYPKNKIVSLKLPAKTRWSALFMTVDSIIRNKEALQCTVLLDHLGIDRVIKKYILDDIFWKNLQYFKQILLPIANSINLIESDKSLLSEVPYVFKYIKDAIINVPVSAENDTIRENLRENLLKYVEERFDFCCKPIHFVANLLDPRFKGKQLNEDQVMMATDFVSEMTRVLNLDLGKVMANLAHFRTGTGFFIRKSLWECVSSTHPVIWWQGLCTSQPLMPVASRILNGPPSSASSERNWSLHGIIHTNKRNRLTKDKVQKLVAIQSSLNLDENDKFAYSARPFPLLEQADMDVEYMQDSEEEEYDAVESESDVPSEDSNSDFDDEMPLSALASAKK